MNVLILYGSNLFPTTRANQQRVYQKILSISEHHRVEVVAFYHNEEQKHEAIHRLGHICKLHLFRTAPASLTYKIIELRNAILRRLTLSPKGKRDSTRDYYRKDIANIVTSNNYDAVIAEYWYWASLFDLLPPSTTRIIDTHNVNFQKKALQAHHRIAARTVLRDRRLTKYRRWEMEAYEKSDVLIAIARRDERFFRETFAHKRVEYIPMGIDLAMLERYRLSPQNNTILFYGGMSDPQNKLAFWRLYERILPRIRRKQKDVRLLVVGNEPPADILALDSGKEVTITGYVEDTLPYLCQAKICILPMMTSGGFRGRVLEVMGLGIPTIGTHNALECINFENGEQGFITDDDEEMAAVAVRLLNDEMEWNAVSSNAREFIRDTYSLEEIRKRYLELIATGVRSD